MQLYIVGKEGHSSRKAIREGANPRIRVWLRIEKKRSDLSPNVIVVNHYWEYEKGKASPLTLKDARWWARYSNCWLERIR